MCKSATTIVLLLALVFAVAPVRADSNMSVRTNDSPTYIKSLHPYIRYVRDDSRAWTADYVLANIGKLTWQTPKDSNVSIGRTKDIYWLTFTIDHNGENNKTVILDIDHFQLYEVNATIYREGKLVKTVDFGQKHTSYHRDRTSSIVLTIELLPKQQHTVLFRVDSRTFLDFPTRLMSDIEFIGDYSQTKLIDGAYYGIVLVIVIFNSFVFLTTRDITYLFYVGFICTIGFLFAKLYGDISVYYPSLTDIKNSRVGLLAVIFSTCFAISFLKLRDTITGLHYYLGSLLAINSVTLIATYFLSMPTYFLLAVSYASFLVVGIIAWYQGIRYAKYFTIAWALLCGSGFWLSVALITGQPIETLYDYFRIGSAVEMVLLSFALAERIRILSEERTHFERAALESARSANRFKDNLMSTITHELLTPMNGIRLSLSLLKPSVDRVGQRFLDTAKNSNVHLMNLIESMLIFNEGRRGKLILKPKPLDLKAFLTNVHHWFERHNEHPEIEIKLDFGIAMPDWIVADEKKLSMLLIQLMKNALAHTRAGEIILSCFAEDSAGSKTLMLSVTDTGRGISEEMQSHLFDAFRRTESAITREKGGIGVGLTIVDDILKLMNGSLEIDSQLGQGSTFTMHIPITVPSEEQLQEVRNSAAQARAEATKQDSRQFNNAKILVVEDNPVNMILMVTVLKKANYQTFRAFQGVEALAILEEYPDIAAIFMDCQMPVMDGFEATRRIRQMEQFKELPIIAVTANVAEEDQQRCLDAGMSDYLTKPASRSLIESTLIKWLSKTQSGEPN